jgi:uncharacterized coiled-coil DUF342 family protein
MKTRGIFYTVLLACTLLMLVGCGSKSGVDETKPISEVKAEAETMSVEQLKEIALKYKKAIEAKQPEIDKILEQIKAIPLTEALGEEAKSLKAEVDELTSTVNALRERFQVYYDKLVELKADVSALTL